jgi:hypothetical protein
MEMRSLKTHTITCPAGWYRNSWMTPSCEMCHPGYVSHPGDNDHEWPYRCTSCSIMHEVGEDKKYYQNQRGQECCKTCPRNT